MAPNVRLFDVLILVVAVALGVVLFLQPLRWLVRAWLSDPYYSHGFLVPPISAVLVWRLWGRLSELPDRSSPLGVVLLGVALLLAVSAIFRQAYFAACLALLVLMAGVALYLKGWPAVRMLLFPIVYLVLMIPLPFVGGLALRLQVWTSTFAAGVANLLAVPAQQEGAMLTIPGAAFVVGMACSGLSSIIALVALGTLLIYLVEGPAWVKLVLMLSLMPIAVVANGLRISSLLWIADRFGSEVGVLYHDTAAGFVSWGLAVALLIFGIRLFRCRLSLAV